MENKVQNFLIMDFQQEFYVQFVVLASDAGIFGTDVDVIFGTDKYEKKCKIAMSQVFELHKDM